jgi:ribosomal protein S18 acetylase RimI-like enzyme
VHESGGAAAIALKARGYRYDSSTRTMAMAIADFAEPDISNLDLVDLAPTTTLMAFDHEGDCGIYMVETTPSARRRGLATALSAYAVAEGKKRGCTTASLQATPIAEGVYARVGFRDLGRFDEYVPRSDPQAGFRAAHRTRFSSGSPSRCRRI